MSSTARSTTDSLALNLDINELHDLLVGMAADLAAQIGNAESVEAVHAITTEISEINHRVTLAGNLLFASQTAAITKATDKVRDATKDVQNSIQEISSTTQFIKDMTAFLQLVDKVIDTAKLVVPGL
jgi:hypothetical protein